MSTPESRTRAMIADAVMEQFADLRRQGRSITARAVHDALLTKRPDLAEVAREELAVLGVSLLLSNVNSGRKPWTERP